MELELGWIWFDDIDVVIKYFGIGWIVWKVIVSVDKGIYYNDIFYG